MNNRTRKIVKNILYNAFPNNYIKILVHFMSPKKCYQKTHIIFVEEVMKSHYVNLVVSLDVKVNMYQLYLIVVTCITA